MAKSIKKVSIAAMDRVAKEHFPDVVTEYWFDNEVVIKRTLSLAEMLTFVDSVVSNCYYDVGGYMPEVKDFVIKSNILTKYANFNLPDNLEHCYALVYGTDAVDVVLKHVSQAQLQDILNAIECKIEYLCDSNISAIEQQMREVAASFGDMQKKTEEVFSNIGTEDIEKLVRAININGNVDEEKLVNAFLANKPTSEEEPGDE